MAIGMARMSPCWGGDASVPCRGRWVRQFAQDGAITQESFSIDMENYSQCGGKLELVAALMESTAVEEILKHVGRPYKPPDIAPVQYPDQFWWNYLTDRTTSSKCG